MPTIENNPYANVLSSPAAQAQADPVAFGGVATPAYAPSQNDAITPIYRFPQPGPIGPQPWQPPWSNAGNGSGLLAGFSSLMNGFVNALQSMFASLAQQFGFGAPGSQPYGGDTFVGNATASSVGDPHDALSGTNAAGLTIGGKWNNMQSHADLLDSDSIAGGYTVSTTVTQPNQNGVTMNASATVALDGGQTDVTMNANGSSSVSSYGNNVQLQSGQSIQLSDGATVTLGNDGALTVADSNGSGGTISTRLASNGHGGVDVNATANDIDLGGYLVNRTDSPPPVVGPPTAPLPLSPVAPLTDPYSFETWDAPEATPTSAVSVDPGPIELE